MYGKTHFYTIWQIRGYNTYKHTYISEYERLKVSSGNISWKRHPYLTAWNTAFLWRLLLVLSGQLYPCSEGGLPLRLPAIFMWNLTILLSSSSFWRAPWSPHFPHHPNFGLLFLFVCVSIQGHCIFCNFCLNSRNVLLRCDLQFVCHCGQLKGGVWVVPHHKKMLFRMTDQTVSKQYR